MVELKQKAEPIEEPTAHGRVPEEMTCQIIVSEAAWEEMMERAAADMPPSPIAKQEAAEYLRWLHSTGQASKR
jgi:hypothetical protein